MASRPVDPGRSLYEALGVKPRTSMAHPVRSHSLAHGSLAAVWCTRIRGELATGCRSSHHKLVFGRPGWVRTMMQPCASAAKFRSGGSILHRGLKARLLLGAPPPRIVIGNPPEESRERAPKLCFGQAIHAAGRRTTPSGTSPVLTIRHSPMSSFLASATIMVLRVLPRASAVRARYHFAKALSF
jgi:hypothetical protein